MEELRKGRKGKLTSLEQQNYNKKRKTMEGMHSGEINKKKNKNLREV